MQKADKLTFINRADRKVIPSHKTLPMPILSQMTFRSNLTTSSYNSQTVCFGHLDCHSGTEKPYHAFLENFVCITSWEVVHKGGLDSCDRLFTRESWPTIFSC